MYSKLKKIKNLKLFTVYYTLYNFRLYSVLTIIHFAAITRSYTLALSIFSIAQISQAVFELPTGIYSDYYGRSSCLRLGALAALLSIVAYTIAPTYLFLVIGALFEGLNRACFSGNNDALLYETLAEKGRTRDYQHEYGRIHSWLELSGLTAGIVGGLVATRSLTALFSLSIIPQLMAFLVSFGFRDPRVHREQKENVGLHLKNSWNVYRKNLKVRLVSLAEIIGFAVGETSWSFQSVFYNLFLPTWAVSFVMSLNFLTSAISFRLSGRILARFSATKVLFYQEVYGRLLYLAALIFPSIASPFMFAAASVTYGPGTVAKSSLLQTEFTNEQRATMTSINSLFGNCLYAIVSILIGYFADKYGATKSMLLGQLCLLPLVAIFYKLNSLKNED